MIFRKIIKNFLNINKFILLSSITPILLYLFSVCFPILPLKFLLILSTFFLVPFNIGRLIYSCIIRQKCFSNRMIYIFSCWLVGSLLVFLLFMIFSNIFYFCWSFFAFCVLLLFIPLLFDVVSLKLSKNNLFYLGHDCYDKDHLRAQIVFFIFLGVIGICSLILTSRIEIPNLNEIIFITNYINSWDVKDSLKIFYDAPFNFQRGSFPFEALLVAISSSLSRVYPLYVYSYIGLTIAFLYPFIIYCVAEYITKDKITSLVISIISAFGISSVSLNFALCPGMGTKIVYPILTIFILDWINKHEKTTFLRRMKTISSLLVPCMMLIGANILGVLTPYEGYFIILRNLLIVIAVSLSLILSIHHKDEIYSIVTILILINPLSGVMLLLPYFLLMMVFPYLNKPSNMKRVFFLLYTFTLVTLCFAIYYGLIAFSNPHIISSIFHKPKPVGWVSSRSPQEKIVSLLKYGPSVLTYLGIFGMIFSLIFPERDDYLHGKRRNIFLLAFVASVYLYILIFPEGETHRVSHAFTFLFPLFGMSSIRTLLKFLDLRRYRHLKSPSKKKVVRQITLSTILLLIFSSFLTYYVIQESPRIQYVNNLKRVNPDRIASYYTKSEIRIFEWFFYNTPIRKEYFPFFNTHYLQNDNLFRKIAFQTKIGNITQHFWFSLSNDTLVISDPFTMASLNVMTLRDVLMPQVVFIFEDEYNKYSLKFFAELKKAFKTENSSLFVEKIIKLKNELYGDSDKEVYVVISKRTLTWLKSNRTFVYFPARTVNWNLLNNTLSNRCYFDLIYRIPNDVYVFKFKRL